MVVTAKAAIEAFDGSGPQKSYWNSCSTGGRQGLDGRLPLPGRLRRDQRDGPGQPMTDPRPSRCGPAGNRSAHAGRGAGDAARLAAVHAAAVKQCDKLDGLEDGLIGRPGACTFDPGTVEGLSTAQVETSVGDRPGAAGPARLAGGQRDAARGGRGRPGAAPGGAHLLQHAGARRPRGLDWNKFDYTRDAEAGRRYGADILDVPPTGLAAFFARGGKLLLSHGWTDGPIPATNALRSAMTGSCPRSARSSRRASTGCSWS